MELRNRIPVLIRYLVIVIMTWLIMPGIAAGQYRVGGTIVDAHDGSPLSGATVVLTHKSTSPPKAVVSLREGQFGFDGVAAGEYELSVKFLGYEELRKGVKVDTGEVRLGRTALRPVSKELDEIDARATMIRQEQRGDTTVFNAAAFKVSPDATTEDLLKKMPGMQVKDGTVKHAGEEIKKVLVDGKEFFSSDPSIALRNIDASLVDKIEVFDKQSEQSEFTGISDGNEERTLNILTKSRFLGGSFGQAYGGAGTDWHYETGFTSNTIHDGNRLSVIAQINDIGQRGLAPVSTTTPSSGKYTAALCAINTSISRNPKLNFDAGFSFNLTKTGNHSNSLQEYLVKDDNEEPRIYESETYSDNNNKDHHLNTRIHWKIDSLNTIDFKPDISWQRNEAYNDNAGQDTRGQDTLRTTSRRSNNSTEKLTLRGSLTINHKFLKPRRTISLRLTYGKSQSDTDTESQNNRSGSETTLSTTGQKSDSDNQSHNASATLAYTEPLGKRLSLMLSYTPQLSFSQLDKIVEADTLMETASGELSNYRFSPILSNNKESRYITHRPSLTLTYTVPNKMTASIGFGTQKSILDGEQTYPLPIDTRRSFFSFMPDADIRIGNKKARRLRLTYRTSTTAPNVALLQDVVDISNIRCYTSGNPDLKQSYTHNIRVSFISNNRDKSRIMFVSSTIRVTNDQIVSASYIADTDSVIRNGIILPAGTQFEIPVNLNRSIATSLAFNASTPIKWQGSMLNVNLRLDTNKTPGLYMGERTTNREYILSGGASIANCLGEMWDFNVGYDASYNIIRNDHAASNNYNYYKHNISADVKLNVLNNHLFLNNTLRHDLTSGMGDNYDANTLIWNAAIGGRFMKNNSGELRLRVSDILDNAQGRSRNVGTASVTTSSHSVIGRYAMLTFTYKFKGLNSGNAPASAPSRKGAGYFLNPRN